MMRYFCITRGNAAPPLEVQESILNEVAQFIDFFVIFALYFTIFPRWNHRLHTLFFSLINNYIAVITAICQQIFRGETLDQAACKRTIRCGTLRNSNSDWHTKRIHGQM